MIDARLLPLQRRLLAGPGAWLAARGATADQVTLCGFALGLLSVPALAGGYVLTALALIVVNRLFDGLDGAVARASGPHPRGAFLDISADFLFYALVPLGFAMADPAANALPAAVLIAAFMGTGSSFLAFAAVAAAQGRGSADYPDKGIPYIGGLTEGAETIGVFVAMCLFPQQFAWLAYGFAAACTLTTASRWVAGWRAFSPGAQPLPTPAESDRSRRRAI
ncbi:MAG: CDP-alcohol phosphatidyltransferase family protein [Gemmobacter sp.]